MSAGQPAVHIKAAQDIGTLAVVAGFSTVGRKGIRLSIAATPGGG